MSRKRFGRNQKRRLRGQVAEGLMALQSQKDSNMHMHSENQQLKKALHRMIDHFTEINKHSIFLEPKREKTAPRRYSVSPPFKPMYSEADTIIERSFFITEEVARIKVEMQETQDVANGRELLHIHMLVNENSELYYCVDFKYLREHGFKHIKQEVIEELFDNAFEKYRKSL